MQRDKHRVKLYQVVLEELGLRILGGVYAPHQTLPKEDTLCRELGVSRGVLREATKILIEKGLIHSRPRTGTQVLPRRNWNLFDPDVLAWNYKTGDNYEFLQKITEVRRIIEAEAARLAAQRASQEEIQAILAACEEMAGLLNQKRATSGEDFIRLDLHFHNTILYSCRNELISQLGSTMRQALLTGRQMDRHDAQAYISSLAQHRSIARAIAARDAQTAHAAAQRHIEEVWLDIQKRNPKKTPAPPQ